MTTKTKKTKPAPAPATQPASAPEKFNEQLIPLLVPIATLVEDPANVRRHDDRNLNAIRGSLARFGQQKPIVARAADGVVIAGNGTLAAARALGWSRLAVVMSDLVGPDATAYAIADNRTAELAGWDDDTLAAVLGSLKATGDAAVVMATGFAESEIAALLKKAEANFAPGSEDGQSKLDEKGKITCPNCAHEFIAP